VPLEVLWLCGYANRHAWPIVQAFLPTRVIVVQDASSDQASQGKECVFISPFAHSNPFSGERSNSLQVRAC
jgi:hypothetical protein